MVDFFDQQLLPIERLPEIAFHALPFNRHPQDVGDALQKYDIALDEFTFRPAINFEHPVLVDQFRRLPQRGEAEIRRGGTTDCPVHGTDALLDLVLGVVLHRFHLAVGQAKQTCLRPWQLAPLQIRICLQQQKLSVINDSFFSPRSVAHKIRYFAQALSGLKVGCRLAVLSRTLARASASA